MPNRLTDKLLSSRPVPRCLVTEQVDRQINDIAHSRPNQQSGGSLPNRFIIKSPTFSITVPIIAITAVFSRASSYCGRTTAIPSHCCYYRHFTEITVGTPRLHLMPVITYGFPFPSRPVLRFVVFVSPVQPALLPGSPRTHVFHVFDYRSHSRVGDEAESPTG